MAGAAINLAQTAQNFAAAASSYDEHAELQRSIGQALRAQWPALEASSTVLDLGCGTGYDSAWLLQQGLNVQAVDLAEGMLQLAAEKLPALTTHCCDVHQLEHLGLVVDAAWSNCMLQWAEDLPKAFAQIHSSLKPEAEFCGSLFTGGSLVELKTAWAEVDDQPHVVEMPSQAEVKAALEHAGFDLLWSETLNTQRYFAGLAAIRDHLRGLGATNTATARAKGLMGRQQLLRLREALEQFRESQGIRISWQAWLFKAKKREQK